MTTFASSKRIVALESTNAYELGAKLEAVQLEPHNLAKFAAQFPPSFGQLCKEKDAEHLLVPCIPRRLAECWVQAALVNNGGPTLEGIFLGHAIVTLPDEPELCSLHVAVCNAPNKFADQLHEIAFRTSMHYANIAAHGGNGGTLSEMLEAASPETEKRYHALLERTSQVLARWTAELVAAAAPPAGEVVSGFLTAEGITIKPDGCGGPGCDGGQSDTPGPNGDATRGEPDAC